MKITLLFLAVFVAVSHQQYYNYRNYRTMFGYPWFLMPFPHQLQPDAFSNDFVTGNEDVHPEEGGAAVGLIGPIELFDEEEEFSDTQSRIKGASRNKTRPYYSNNDQKARFFFNFPNNGVSNTFNNPLFKTAFFTLTQTLSLTSVQNCVPPNEVIQNVAPCQQGQQGRRRRDTSSFVPEDLQFPITPSNTFSLMPTVLSSTSNDQSFDQLSSSKEDDYSLNRNDRSLDLLLSSKDDITQSEMEMLPTDNYNLREKRFFFNKNQFVVTSVLTTFAFVNQTVTATVNLLNPVPAAGPGPCVPNAIAANGALVTCVNCLPPGFVVCPAPAG